MPSTAPQIHVLMDELEMPGFVAAALRRLNAGIRMSRLRNPATAHADVPADARLVIPSASGLGDNQAMRDLYSRFQWGGCATLVLSPTPLEGGPALPDTAGSLVGFAHNPSADELAGRLSAMCSFQRPFNLLQNQIAELRKRGTELQPAAPPLDQQMRLASQIQRDLLPNPLPAIHGAELTTQFHPAEHVSGDIYDAVRLDERTVGFSLADATGHGMPAALLTMFIRRTMSGKETYNGAYRILPPDEVLQNLNNDLLNANLSQCQFVTAAYALYDEPTRNLSWARGGTPYPILISPGKPALLLESQGALLGAVQDIYLERVELSLDPGDVVLFYTDGLDALLMDHHRRPAIRDIRESAWFQGLRTDTIEASLAEVSDRIASLPNGSWPVDDVTLLAVTGK